MKPEPTAELQRYGFCPMLDGKRWNVMEVEMPCRLGDGETIARGVSHEEMTLLVAQPPQARDLPAVNDKDLARRALGSK